MNKHALKLVTTSALAASLALALFDPVAAAPGTPTVAGSAGQASASSEVLSVTTTTTINPGDLVLLAAVSASNQTPALADCLLSTGSACGISWDGKEYGLALAGQSSTPGFAPSPNQGNGGMDNNPIRARTWAGYATATIPTGSTFRAVFRGAVGAKAGTIIVIPGAEVSAPLAFGSNSGTSGSISYGTTPSLTSGQLVVATSFVSAGGSDSYTEDGGFTFLHQTSPGAWPAIRVAYKLTGGTGTVSYTLTDSTSRTWVSSYQVAK